MNSSVEINGSTTTFNFQIDYSDKWLGVLNLEDIYEFHFKKHFRRMAAECMKFLNLDLQAREIRYAYYKSIFKLFKEILWEGWEEAVTAKVFERPGNQLIVEILWNPIEGFSYNFFEIVS